MTELQFDRVGWQQDGDGVWLKLRATVPAQAKQLCQTIEDGKLYDAVLKQHRKKRSLDANAYFWKLCGELAAKLRISPTEIYRTYIPDIAGNYEIVPVREDKIDAWEQLWCAGHLGRMVEDMGPCRNIAGYHNIRSFIGSSDYDTAQMSRLIDMVVANCKEQGIETLTPDKLELLKEEWGRNERLQ